MNTLNAGRRLIAAAIAVSATFSIVWSLASFAYPADDSATPVRVDLVARAGACR